MKTNVTMNDLIKVAHMTNKEWDKSELNEIAAAAPEAPQDEHYAIAYDIDRGTGHKLADLISERDKLRAIAEKLAEALQKIAYEPQGKADASHAEVLRDVENIARAALAQWEARHGE